MKLLRLLLLVFVVGTVPGADLSGPGPVLELDRAGDDWKALFSALASQGAVFSTFTEQRWFSVRPKPVVLEGELRHSAELGLCLHYTKPNEQQIVVDSQGVLLRDARGRSRSIKADPNAPRADSILLHVLRFDQAALLQVFELHAARDGARWRLDFVPRTKAFARSLGQVTVEGENQSVQRLQFRRTADQRIEVLIRETRTGVEFTADEKKRFFR
jgi:outer membrane lipoprotein-sorting protein